jgi:DNA-binding winged helix-turn-helix (wHTH) protein
MGRRSPVYSSPEEFTPNERQLLRELSDGFGHRRDDLMRVVFDDSQASPYQIRNLVSRLRKKLRPRGHDIICEARDCRFFYRHVILLSQEDE